MVVPMASSFDIGKVVSALPSRWLFGAGLAALLWPALDETIRTLVKGFWEHGANGPAGLPPAHVRGYNVSMALRGSDSERIEKTLAVMRELVKRDSADQLLRRFAVSVVGECRGHDFHCEIDRCFQFVRDAITYRKDPAAVEYIQDAREMLCTRVGDCDEKACLLASLLGALGHKSRFVVSGPSAGSYSHVYVEVLTRRGWLALDPTNERAQTGWEQRAIARATFDIF